jgi:hypothetical protein
VLCLVAGTAAAGAAAAAAAAAAAGWAECGAQPCGHQEQQSGHDPQPRGYKVQTTRPAHAQAGVFAVVQQLGAFNYDHMCSWLRPTCCWLAMTCKHLAEVQVMQHDIEVLHNMHLRAA